MFEEAAAFDRERPEPSYYQGLCYLAIADRKFRDNNLPGALRYCDRAIAAFDSAVSAFPGYSRAVQAKADALRLKGRHQSAIDITNWAAKQSGPRAKMLLIAAEEHAQAGDLDMAQLKYEQACAVEPRNAGLYAELGLFYLRCSNEAKAVESLRRAYQLDPGAPGVLDALQQLDAAPEVAPAPAS